MSASTLASRPFQPVAPSILALAVASVAAVCAWPQWHILGAAYSCGSPEGIEAGHINTALGLVLLCGVFGSTALLLMRYDPHALGVTLLILAALLSISVALVLSASGTYAINWGAEWPGVSNCPGRPVMEIHRV
jgi:hypothetical protein